jgi:hypothetical protein
VEPTIVPMNKMYTPMKVQTPHGECVKFNILDKSYVVKYGIDNLTPVDIIINGVHKIPVYELNKQYVIQYTKNGHGLLLKNEDVLRKLFYNEEYSPIALLWDKHENEYYWGFNVYTPFIARILKQKKYEVLEGFQSIYYSNMEGEVDPVYQAIQFADDSILYFVERAPGVYQGTWFEDFRSFAYFYKNDYA